MRVTETFRPLPGELALQIAPTPALRVGAGLALRRARFDTGRALTADVLEGEQAARSQIAVALQGALATGVVTGFETPYTQPGGGASALIDVLPGLGLAQGEDVILPAAVRLQAASVPVALESIEDAGPLWTPADRELISETPERWSLGALSTHFAGRGLATAAVLIARPIRLLRNLQATPGGACLEAPDIAEQQLVFDDALRFEWVLWPHRRHPLPVRDAAWRNRLAWRVFDAEAARQPWPWTALGLPIALAGFVDVPAGRLAFLDRQAVVREGGGLRLREQLLSLGSPEPVAAAAAAGLPPASLGAGLDEPLAQAQVLQLQEHLAELDVAQLQSGVLARQFTRLPPAGMLPGAVVDVDAAHISVFPPNWNVTSRVIPDGMVSALMAESARLAPLSLARAEQVELLVPVPAASFDRDLLRLDEPVDPQFHLVISELEDRREAALHERAGWQHRREVLAHAMSGLWPERPESDPQGLADERDDGTSRNAGRFFPRVHTGGVANTARLEAHGFDAAQDTLVLVPGDRLMAYVEIVAAQPPQVLLLQPILRNTVAGTPDRAQEAAGPVFWWGAPGAPAPALTNVPAASVVLAGHLPAAAPGAEGTRWLRLEVDISFFALGAAQATLEGLAWGVMCGTTGAAVSWGHAGAVRAGRERHWVAETMPQGASLRVTAGLAGATGGAGEWPWQDRRAATTARAAVEGFILDEAGNSHALADVSGLVLQAQGSAALQELQQAVVPATAGTRAAPRSPNQRALHTGLARLVEALDAKTRQSNDLVELGFLRSRVDLYRLRTRLLGADEADRLLTSPAVAELVKRGASSFATDQQLTSYLSKALITAMPAAKKAVPAPATRERGATPVLAGVAAATRDGLQLRITRPVVITQPGRVSPVNTVFSGATSGSGTKTSGAATTAAGTAEATAGNGGLTMATTDSNTGLAAALAGLGIAERLAIATGGKTATTTKSEAIAALAAGIAPVAAGTTADEVAGASSYTVSQNTVTLGERLQTPVVVDAWGAAANGKTTTVGNTALQLGALGMPTDALPVFGYRDASGKAVTNVRDMLAAQQANQLANIDLDDNGFKFEADYFRKGLDAVDNSIRFLRGVESLVESYRRVRGLAQAALDRLAAMVNTCANEIARLDTQLAEIRHDLGVARALLAEERQRIAALLAQRRSVLAQVSFVVFRRPRLANRFDDLPVRSVETGTYVSPVRDNLDSGLPVPVEILRMVQTMRDLPARHFNRLAELLASIDNRDELGSLLTLAGQRATLRTQAAASASVGTGSGLGAAVQALQFSAQTMAVQHAATVLQQLPQAASLTQLSWSALGDLALTHLAVADLFHSTRTLGASGELDDVARVAAGLHRALGGVPPAARLTWALQLSTFDAAPSLRQLSVLPRFGDDSLGLGYADWRGLQDRVSWLFSRIDARSAAAERLMNDLVRLVILLASHAPVRELIPGRLLHPVRPLPGVLLQLSVDALAPVRVGMELTLAGGIAKAVVSDLAPGRVTAQVTQASDSAPTLAADTMVQIAAAMRTAATMSVFSSGRSTGR